MEMYGWINIASGRSWIHGRLFTWINLPTNVTNTYIFPFYRQISREIFMKITRDSSAYFLRKYKKRNKPLSLLTFLAYSINQANKMLQTYQRECLR